MRGTRALGESGCPCGDLAAPRSPLRPQELTLSGARVPRIVYYTNTITILCYAILYYTRRS